MMTGKAGTVSRNTGPLGAKGYGDMRRDLGVVLDEGNVRLHRPTPRPLADPAQEPGRLESGPCTPAAAAATRASSIAASTSSRGAAAGRSTPATSSPSATIVRVASAPVPPFDIVGVGVAAVDDLVRVPAYPPPDTKLRVLSRERRAGGLTATALVAAARLGARCAYAGVLGRGDEPSRFTLENLVREGVDVSHVARVDDAGPVQSVIVVGSDPPTRNVFSDASRTTDLPTHPSAELLATTPVLLVDHVYPAMAIRAAHLVRDGGGAVVADLEKDVSHRFGELLDAVDHLVLSRAFACRITDAADAADAVRRLVRPGRTVVVTCGAEGAWYGTHEDDIACCPAFRVAVVDTTGCGDVFHGAYAAALIRGFDLADRVRFASAVSALKATRPGAQAGAPDLRTVEQFLAAHRD
jgi:sulfofructose kinase